MSALTDPTGPESPAVPTVSGNLWRGLAFAVPASLVIWAGLIALLVVVL